MRKRLIEYIVHLHARGVDKGVIYRAILRKTNHDYAKRLLKDAGLPLTVADLMHQGDALPVVTRSASMDEIVITATQKKLGAVLVADGKKLLGIITDGDLRRSLQKKEKFFSLKAEDVMTRDPVSIQATAMAQEALELMENRPSQISVLPVVDRQGSLAGLIRLHDLVRSF